MTASLLLTFLSVAALVCGGVVPHLPETRILGGEEIEISDAPWQVHLKIGCFYYGGSIISARWVVTAAHCTYGLNPKIIQLMVGTKKFMGSTNYRVVEIVIHDQYVHGKYLNDISLLKTKDIMAPGFSVKAVTLPAPGAKKPLPRTKLVVSGWGLKEDGRYAPFLRAWEVEVRDYKDCQTHGPSDEATQICAGSSGKDFCPGDSGGPLVQGEVLVGVASFRRNKTCGILPGVYTDVAAYRTWIITHINN